MRADLAEVAVMARRLSPERLTPYVIAAGSDTAAALRLYAWNVEVSGALAATIGHVEIILRNAIHENLTDWSTRRFGERQALHRAFPGQAQRRIIQDAVEVLHRSRNRLAHHEPMFNRPIADIHVTALELVGWICPVSRGWIERRCRTAAMLRKRP